MFGWAKAAICGAIEVLAQSQQPEFAADLRRFLEAVDVDGLDLMRCADADGIADEIVETEDVDQIREALWRIARMLGADHCTLHLVQAQATSEFTTRVITTYPKDWIGLYLSRRYYFVDPVIQACRAGMRSFHWAELPSSSPVLRQFWSDARAHGVGPSGYTYPVTTPLGDTLAVSVCARQDDARFREAVAYHESDLALLGELLAERFSQLAGIHRPPLGNLTDDQILLLREVLRGVDEEELEARSYQYGSFATIKRYICSRFETRTLVQAALVATRAGLLDNLPLTEGDVRGASDWVATSHSDETTPPTALPDAG